MKKQGPLCGRRRSCAMLATLALTTATTSISFPLRANPEPPRIRLEVDPASARPTGTTHRPATAEDLRAALANARPGDAIILVAGRAYVGNFTLPAKSGDGWITIQSSALDRLPGQRVRVMPADAPAMPKLVAPNDRPALSAAPGAAHYRLVGVEISQAPDVAYNYGLVDLGSDARTPDAVPHDIILDRVYIHGLPNAALKRGVALNSAATVIANSWISECHVEGQDAQAICGFTGPGQFKIANCHLEGSGENLMFGGSDPRIPDLVPSDIEIIGNHFFKPHTWRKQEPDFGGKAWTVKNLLEIKNGRRLHIEGNIFEYSWAHGQVGFAVLLCPRNQGGNAPWCTVEDVAFVNNVIRHCSSGISILAQDDNHRSQNAKRILIRNNLLKEINPTRWGGDGRLLMLLSSNLPIEELVVENNTMLHGGKGNTFITLGGKGITADPFVFANNVVTSGQYAIHGSGKGSVGDALDAYTGTYRVEGNLVIGTGGGARAIPLGNIVVKSMAEAGFVDPAEGNYRIAPNAAWRSKAASSATPGADIDALDRATVGAVSGRWPLAP